MDRELLKEISAVSELYEDVNINGRIVSLIFTGMNGVYVCTENVTDDVFCVGTYDAVKNKLGLRDNQIFLFVIAEDDSGRFYDYQDGFVQMENIYEAYENCYANHLIPQADMFHIEFKTPASYCESVEYEPAYCNYEEDVASYIAPVISEKQIIAIEKKLIDILNEPVVNGQYRTFPDGRMEIKRTLTQSVAGISTFVTTGTAYYPCMDMDGEKFFLLTFLGGWLGLHKFKTGNYLKGLFYALTCGCCGVFYILDLVSIMFGGYNYSMITCDRSQGTVEFKKKRFYSRPLQNKKKAVLFVILSVIITFLLVNFVYRPVLDGVNVFISTLLSDTSFAENLASQLTLY